jgi:signal transduction histidine kinase
VDGLRVLSDPMLEKVFHNMVDNSIRHGRAEEIRLFYDMGKEGLKLVYSDDGDGIPHEDKKGLFEGEFGHGMLLVRDILAITGMTIRESGVPGEGARFEILVPQGKYRLT